MKNILSGINPQREMYLNKEYAISCNRITAAVDFHRRAIEFVDLFKYKSLLKLKLRHISKSNIGKSQNQWL